MSILVLQRSNRRLIKMRMSSVKLMRVNVNINQLSIIAPVRIFKFRPQIDFTIERKCAHLHVVCSHASLARSRQKRSMLQR